MANLEVFCDIIEWLIVVTAAVMDKIGGLLASNITPFIAPMLKAFEQPVSTKRPYQLKVLT